MVCLLFLQRLECSFCVWSLRIMLILNRGVLLWTKSDFWKIFLATFYLTCGWDEYGTWGRDLASTYMHRKPGFSVSCRSSEICLQIDLCVLLPLVSILAPPLCLPVQLGEQSCTSLGVMHETSVTEGNALTCGLDLVINQKIFSLSRWLSHSYKR